MSKAPGLGTLQVLLNLALVHLTIQYCYKLTLLSYETKDTPNYRVNMSVSSNGTISSLTNVYKEIPSPYWHIKLTQRSNNYHKMHYNGTIKACEFRRFAKRVRVFRELTSLIVHPESGNMSLKCPMPVGNYVLQNLRAYPDSAVLKFFYTPNSLYTLYGGVLSQLPNKRMERMCSYEINATIVKEC